MELKLLEVCRSKDRIEITCRTVRHFSKMMLHGGDRCFYWIRLWLLLFNTPQLSLLEKFSILWAGIHTLWYDDGIQEIEDLNKLQLFFSVHPPSVQVKADEVPWMKMGSREEILLIILHMTVDRSVVHVRRQYYYEISVLRYKKNRSSRKSPSLHYLSHSENFVIVC